MKNWHADDANGTDENRNVKSLFRNVKCLFRNTKFLSGTARFSFSIFHS